MEIFDSLSSVRPIRIWQDTYARSIQGERITLAVVDLPPNSSVPEHSHSNEQLGFVLKGSITMTVAGKPRTLGPGETYAIAGGIPHGAVAGPDGASVVDAFSPIRADWGALERAEPHAGDWP